MAQKSAATELLTEVRQLVAAHGHITEGGAVILEIQSVFELIGSGPLSDVTRRLRK